MSQASDGSVVYRVGSWAAIACEHISYDGNIGRWVRLAGEHGPQEIYATWNRTLCRWELGERFGRGAS